MKQVIGGQDEPLGAALLLMTAKTENRGDYDLETEPDPEPVRRADPRPVPGGRREKAEHRAPASANRPVQEFDSRLAVLRPHRGQKPAAASPAIASGGVSPTIPRAPANVRIPVMAIAPTAPLAADPDISIAIPVSPASVLTLSWIVPQLRDHSASREVRLLPQGATSASCPAGTVITGAKPAVPEGARRGPRWLKPGRWAASCRRLLHSMVFAGLSAS